MTTPLAERLWARVDRDADGGCWLWTGPVNRLGYATIYGNGRKWYIHRLAWTLMRGPVPAGLVVDHLCNRPACCNPSHLEPITQAENVRRAHVRRWVEAGVGHEMRGYPIALETIRR